MFVSISELNLADVLNLDKSLGPGELDELADNLTQEIFFRFLTEELPKLLTEKDFGYIRDKYMLGGDLDSLMDEVSQKWPGIKIDWQLRQVSSKVKKDFINNYYLEMKNDYKDPSLHRYIDDLLKEINSEQINLSLILQLKEKIRQTLAYINRK